MSSPKHSAALAHVHPDVWLAHTLATPLAAVVASGEATLDAELPGGGWPVGALTEILQPAGVHAEWRLLLPALVRCGSGGVVLVAPPHVPFGPALLGRGLPVGRLLWVQTPVVAQSLWAAEQALRCAEVDAVLVWLPQVRAPQLRRLQIAAAEFNKLLFVLRAPSALRESSPAVLRLFIEPAVDNLHAAHGTQRPSDRLQVRVLKRRGPPMERSVFLQATASALECVLAAAWSARDAFAGSTKESIVREFGHALDCTTFCA
ncbi:MAG: translesion DNA synthesis-associated protein ImuA [Rhodoferax sp.]|nr:translesion DNA synthesis-associated protein ImuA [Rhodoferax sp.]